MNCTVDCNHDAPFSRLMSSFYIVAWALADRMYFTWMLICLSQTRLCSLYFFHRSLPGWYRTVVCLAPSYETHVVLFLFDVFCGVQSSCALIGGRHSEEKINVVCYTFLKGHFSWMVTVLDKFISDGDQNLGWSCVSLGEHDLIWGTRHFLRSDAQLNYGSLNKLNCWDKSTWL